MMWPFLLCTGIMSIMFIVAFVSPSEQTRKFTLLTWIALVMVVSNVYYLFVIFNGTIADLNCTDAMVQEYNNNSTTTITAEDCRNGVKYYCYFDFAIKLLINLYFTF